jgi:hypothetical protein
MDRLLVECNKRGLRLLPTLTNYWKEFGGMQQYARCASQAASAVCSSVAAAICHHRTLEVPFCDVLPVGLTCCTVARYKYWTR